MKRIASYLIALATMAFTFTSCEDVPSPFGEIVPPSGDEKVVIEPTGSGTEKDPYNVAAVLEYISGLGADTPSPEVVYIKGYAVELTDISAQYGNATFNMSDDVDGKANKFTVYRAAGLGNQKVTDASFIKQGDVVVVCGKVTNFKGNTPETVQGSAYVYSVNGETGGGGGGGGGGDTPTPGEAKGSGTQADPYNAAGANNFIKTLAADKESDKDIYIKGKLVKYADKGEFSKDFGNASFYLSDDGKESSEQFYVFRTLYLGNVKYTSGDTPKVGDEIIICGKVVNYKGNTPETAANKSYIYSWNGKTEGGGGGSDTPSGDAKGSGTEADPFNVAAAIAKCKETGETATTEKYYIKGIADADYTVSSYKNIEVDIVDAAGSADKFKVFRCKAADNKDIKEGFKVKKGDEIIVYGPVVNYKGNTPETANGAYVVSVNGKAPELDGGGESGGGEGGGGESGGGGVTDGSSITALFADLDCSNVGSIKLSDGTTISVTQEDGKTTPIYHESSKIVRIYARNAITIDSGSKKISQVILAYDTYNGTAYKGNDELYGEVNNNKLTPTKDDKNITFTNVNGSKIKVVNWLESGNSGGVQLRLTGLTIIYN